MKNRVVVKEILNDPIKRAHFLKPNTQTFPSSEPHILEGCICSHDKLYPETKMLVPTCKCNPRDFMGVINAVCTEFVLTKEILANGKALCPHCNRLLEHRCYSCSHIKECHKEQK